MNRTGTTLMIAANDYYQQAFALFTAMQHEQQINTVATRLAQLQPHLH